MNDSETKTRLIQAAIRLFAVHGYEGTSIRAITREANANLGAVTYHFGSKAALFEAALAEVVGPFRERIAAEANQAGPPLDRVAGIVRTFFEHFAEHPVIPQLILHVLASPQHMPEPVRSGLAANHAALARVIAEGQQGGTIRPGDARLMALSIAAQPVMLALMRHVLSQAIGLDQDDRATRTALTESVAAFARAGLAATGDPS
jgi:AcrR family transcriptional regulator